MYSHLKNIDLFSLILCTLKLILIVVTIGCINNEKQIKENKNRLNLENSMDSLEALYYGFVDTVIDYPDERYIVNSTLDTVIYQPGIFTFLNYDYVFFVPEILIVYLKEAVSFENESKFSLAEENYEQIIKTYEEIKKVSNWSDTNSYLNSMINSSIICSYAHEKLSNLSMAIEVLKPYLANSEVYGSKIQERFIKLCIKKYGMELVKEELDSCGSTIAFIKTPISYDNWVVSVFDAKIGINSGLHVDTITIEEASRKIRRMDIYRLVN